jgi:hypothetical protein
MTSLHDTTSLETGMEPELIGYLERFRLRENGGRRLGVDRRIFLYTLYIPERRDDHDRRMEKDRRKAPRAGSRLLFPSL